MSTQQVKVGLWWPRNTLTFFYDAHGSSTFSLSQVLTSEPTYMSINSNVILLSTCRSSKCLLHIRFADHSSVGISSLSHGSYIPKHNSFRPPSRIKTTKLFTGLPPPFSCHLSLRSRYFAKLFAFNTQYTFSLKE